jgi:hypothetical protein
MAQDDQLGVVHPLQLRCARVLLGWSAAHAASAVGISLSTLNRAETNAGPKISRVALSSLRLTYEKHDIEFTFDGGLGVKLKSDGGS